MGANLGLAINVRLSPLLSLQSLCLDPTMGALWLDLHMFEKFANHTAGLVEMRRMTTVLFDLLAAIRHLRRAKKTSRPHPT